MNRYEEEARVLTKQANQICNNVPSTSQILTILQSEETISDIDVQEIESYRTTYERVNRLIVILRTKQLDKKQVTRGIKRPFEALCFALKEMRQTWLAEELTAMLKNERTFASDPGEVEEELENEVKGASDYDARLDDAQNCVDINDNDPDLLLDTNPSEPLSSEASTGNRNTADYIQSPDIGSDEKDDSDSPIKRVDLNNTKQHKCLRRRFLFPVVVLTIFLLTIFTAAAARHFYNMHQDAVVLKARNELIARARGNLIDYFQRRLTDTQKVWVDPTLELDGVTLTNYRKSISEAFIHNDVILVEGDAGTGKSFFLQKIMRDWTAGHFEFSLAFYDEFRHLGDRKSISVADLVFGVVDHLKFLPNITTPNIINAVQHLQQTRNSSILVILDGFDEINKGICEDLRKILYLDSGMAPDTQFKIIISARTNYVPVTSRSRFSRFRIIGFPEWHQKNDYVNQYFSNNNKIGDAKELKKKLNTTKFLNDWAVNPLHMSLLCTVFKDLEEGAELELYEKIAVRKLKQHGLKSSDFRNSTFKICKFAYSSETYDIRDITGEEWKHCSYLHDLGKLAFMMLFSQSRRKFEFSKTELHQYNISTDHISDIGFLVKVIDAIDNEEYVYRFWHISFQEFFAASYYNWLSASSNKNIDWHESKKIQKFVKQYRSPSDFEYFMFRYAIANLERDHVAAVTSMQPFLGRYKTFEFSISKADIKIGKQPNHFLTRLINVTHLSLFGGAGIREDNDESLSVNEAVLEMKNLHVLTLRNGNQSTLPILATMRLSQLNSIAFKSVHESMFEWKKTIQAISKLGGKLEFIKIRCPQKMESAELSDFLEEPVECSDKVTKLFIRMDRRDRLSTCDKECSEKMIDAINSILRRSSFEAIEFAAEYAHHFSISLKHFPSAKRMLERDVIVYNINVAEFLENTTFHLDLIVWENQDTIDIKELLLNKYPNTALLAYTGLLNEDGLLIPSSGRLQSAKIYISFTFPDERIVILSEHLSKLKRVKFIGCPWTSPEWAKNFHFLGRGSQKLELLHINCNDWSSYLNSHVFVTEFFNLLANFSRPVEKQELFETKKYDRSTEPTDFRPNNMTTMVKQLARCAVFAELILDQELVSFSNIHLEQFPSIEYISSKQIFIIKREDGQESEEEKYEHELNSNEIILRIFRSINDTHIIINATLEKNYQIIHQIIAEKEISKQS